MIIIIGVGGEGVKKGQSLYYYQIKDWVLE